MTERFVKNTGRPIYGRSSLTPPRKRGRRVVNPFGVRTRRFLILTVVIVAILLIVKQIFAIKTVSVDSTTRGAELQAAAVKAINGSWWQDNLLTFNADRLAAKLQADDPMVSSVSVRRKWPNQVNLSITLKQPSIGWSSGNQQYLIDFDGTAIGPLPAGSDLAVVQDGSNLPVTIGNKVVSSKFVKYVLEAVPALKASGINIRQLRVKDTTLDLYVQTDKGYYLLVDTGRPIADTIADLKQVTAALAAQKRVPAEYIDLRIPNKAYFK